ncbi:MAG: Kinesin heavy chain [Candelina mexicana]|nr:MAG: Kinesin heavy chain [Candelina mexicana]
MAAVVGTGSYNTIKVVARFRPQNKIELASGGEPIVAFQTEDTCHLDSKDAAGSFTFDRVFDMASRQTDVFDFSIRSTVDDILNGYNGTVFAYGQTGAGKSYTMMGSDIDNDESRGIIPRIVEQIFASILASPSNIEYTVRVSYMEIYMERIRDLLAPQNDNLPVHEEKSRGVYVKGLLEIYVSSVQEVYEVMRRGGTARATAATNMNLESSRSHSIFVITITQKNVETGSAKSGQLFLVDLAGSEKVGKTGASGQTLEEAKKINKSLSALGMVINSLTDGKSTHIPYRDSKLTRILQESLGGNSRTTLIINCSPSSYNDAETLSTLRFGVRAKAIKNKAKINAELSPLELKQLLKKAQNQVTTFENYVTTLEGEVQLWRSGESVPKERWVLPISAGSANGRRTDSKAPRSETPSRLQPETGRAETPQGRSDSRMLDRSSTPSSNLERDEREDFLRRENELQDQVAEKETQLATVEAALREAKDELQYLKEHDTRTGKENEKLNSEVNELRMQVEKVSFESKEAFITMDGFKEANNELTAELDEVKQQLLDVKMSAKDTSALLDEKEKKKAERMASMMASFDLGDQIFSHNVKSIQKAIEQVDAFQETSAAGEAIASDDLDELRAKLLETQRIVRQAEINLAERADQGRPRSDRQSELEMRLAHLQRDYVELLEQNLDPRDIETVQNRLEQAYTDKRDTEQTMVEDLRSDVTQKVEENLKLKTEMQALQRRVKASGPLANGHSSPNGVGGKTVQQQIAEFDVMKKSLMRDLQNRCERVRPDLVVSYMYIIFYTLINIQVVELEISLDETREQYNNVLRSSNNRAQQKKMAFLERNLEQLTHVQRQLVEQNGSLKKEVAIAERKLNARNDRIQSLESLLHDSQEKLTAANHRFEAQLMTVKERLEAAKVGSARGLSASNPAGFSFGGAGPRIAKPLRGGGGTGLEVNAGGGGPSLPILSGLQAQESGNSGSWGKRNSWFSSMQRSS